MLLVVQHGLPVRLALALFLVDLLLIYALVPGGLAQLAGAVPNVTAIHLPQRLGTFYGIRKTHKAVACSRVTKT